MHHSTISTTYHNYNDIDDDVVELPRSSSVSRSFGLGGTIRTRMLPPAVPHMSSSTRKVTVTNRPVSGSIGTLRARSVTPLGSASTTVVSVGDPSGVESDVLSNYRLQSAKRFSNTGGYHPKYAARIGMNNVSGTCGSNHQHESLASRPLAYSYKSTSTPRLNVNTKKTTASHLVYPDYSNLTQFRKHNDNDYLLNYQLPDASFTRDIKSALGNINLKMAEHRSLMDRYSSIDLDKKQNTPGVDYKYHQMASRMPELSNISREERSTSGSLYNPPFTVRSDVAANSRMKINRIMSRCR